jgi:hypothetical protein
MLLYLLWHFTLWFASIAIALLFAALLEEFYSGVFATPPTLPPWCTAI